MCNKHSPYAPWAKREIRGRNTIKLLKFALFSLSPYYFKNVFNVEFPASLDTQESRALSYVRVMFLFRASGMTFVYMMSVLFLLKFDSFA